MGLVGVERGQQLLPLHAHPQPQQQHDLRRGVQGQPEHAEGTRATAGGNLNILGDQHRSRSRSRCATGASTAPTASRRTTRSSAPAAAANADWVAFPGAATFLDLNPSGGVRRDSTGSRIGIIAQDNWPGGRRVPVERHPAVAHVDYFRITPDNCPAGADHTAPTTTATAAPAAPNGTNGWYTSDVNVTLAGNDSASGSGIDKIEYKVDGGAFATYSAPIAVTTPARTRSSTARPTRTATSRPPRRHGQGRQGRADDHRDARAGHDRPGRHLHRSRSTSR